MGVRLPSPFRLSRRNSVVRFFPAVLCMLLLLLATLRADTFYVRSRFLQQTGGSFSPFSDQQSQTSLGNAFSLSRFGAKPTVKMNCTPDFDYLNDVMDRYNLDQRFQYLKRYVRFNRKEGLQRKRMTKLSQNFLPDSFQTLDLGLPLGDDFLCHAPLEVDVPASPFPQNVNASDFMFGVSTTYKRFMDPESTPTDGWIFWLTDGYGNSNGGKLLLMLLGATDEQLQEVADILGEVGIDADIYHSDSSSQMAVRYFTLVPTLFLHPESASKKWLVTCDDDTYFTSMHALIAKMETFDHTMDLYIGTLSEDVGAVERHGSQAFGGAGVFLTRSMAEKITHLWSNCTSEAKMAEIDTPWGPQGDTLLRSCIYENTEVRLTTIQDLWQLDFFGDPSGFYEWGIKTLSVHHYRSSTWHTAKPEQYTKISYTCGEDCTLMRFQSADDFIISGYSVAQYPKGITFDTNQMEGTLHAAPEDKGWNLDFVFGPQRHNLEKTGRKMAWELQESDLHPDGSISQTYIRLKDDERWVHKDNTAMNDMDGIIELIWIPA